MYNATHNGLYSPYLKWSAYGGFFCQLQCCLWLFAFISVEPLSNTVSPDTICIINANDKCVIQVRFGSQRYSMTSISRRSYYVYFRSQIVCLKQDCSNPIANALWYCSLALSHQNYMFWSGSIVLMFHDRMFLYYFFVMFEGEWYASQTFRVRCLSKGCLGNRRKKIPSALLALGRGTPPATGNDENISIQSRHHVIDMYIYIYIYIYITIR